MLLHEPFGTYRFVSYEVSADMTLRFVTAVPYPYGTILDGNRPLYRGADKTLARPYSDQDLQHNVNTYDVQTTAIYCCCLCAISVGIVV